MENEGLEDATTKPETTNVESTENTESVDNSNTETTTDNTDNVNVDNTESTDPEEPQTNEETTNGNADETMYSEKDLLEKFENVSENLEGLIQLAKEGFENRKNIIKEALDSGVHSMGNAFNKEVFEKTFSNMQTKDIQEMGKVWEQQAKDKFAKDKVSKQNFSNNDEEEIKIDMKQFKTSIY